MLLLLYEFHPAPALGETLLLPLASIKDGNGVENPPPCMEARVPQNINV